MKVIRNKISIITEDAFSDYRRECPGVCLDIIEDSKCPHLFRLVVFDSIGDVPVIRHKSWEYIYVIEIDGGKFIKIGFSKDIKARLRTHMSDKDSPFCGRCGRVALLGPIRDGLNTEQIIHESMGLFYAGDSFPEQTEVYSMDAVERSFPEYDWNKMNNNMFDLFCCRMSEETDVCIFDIIQMKYYIESRSACIYPQELIVPRVRF